MAENRGKKFEKIIKESFLKVPDVSVDRLPDPQAGYLGIRNICDFIVYKKPYQYYIECKSVHGNTLPFSNITENQWNGLLEKSKIDGVIAGVICWWVDNDMTKFIPIDYLLYCRDVVGMKSIQKVNYDFEPITQEKIYLPITLQGKKKRVFFDYDMNQFFKEVEHGKNSI